MINIFHFEQSFLLDIAIILFATKLFGLVTKKLHLPQVVGALVAGLILGPSIFGFIDRSEMIENLSTIGVILLMFTAGLETDLKQIKSTYKSATLIAVFGVGLPLIGGIVVGSMFLSDVLEMIFIGIILTATSVSITIETLLEMGVLKSKSGSAIVNSAIIDDILGIIALTFIIAISSQGGSIGVAMAETLFKIFLFFIFSLIIGYFAHKLFVYIDGTVGHKHRSSIFAMSLCLFMAYAAEVFGLADITGAYLTGLILSNTNCAHYIEEKTNVLSYMFFSPIFFASIGLQTDLKSVSSDGNVILFGMLLLVVAIFTKIGGCFIGGKLCKYSNTDALKIGGGMVGRGEVALIVASKGVVAGVIGDELFTPIVFIVIVTTLITPILLNYLYNRYPEKNCIN